MPTTTDTAPSEYIKLQSKNSSEGVATLLDRVQDQIRQRFNPVLAALAPVLGETLTSYLTVIPDPPRGSTETTDFTTATIFAADPVFPAVPITPAVTNVVPVTSAARGELGDLCVSKEHLYICVGHNLWRRVAISAF